MKKLLSGLAAVPLLASLAIATSGAFAVGFLSITPVAITSTHTVALDFVVVSVAASQSLSVAF